MSDEESRRAGRDAMTSTLRRNARRRAQRYAQSIGMTPAGRELLAAEASAIEGARVAAKMIAKSVLEFRDVLVSSIDAYAESVAEYGFASSTAKAFALQSAIFSCAAYKMLGDAFAQEGGTRNLAMTKSAHEGDVRASMAIAGFRDLAALAGGFMSKSQVALETAWRAEDRARLEAAERERQRTAEQWRQRAESERIAREQAAHPELPAAVDVAPDQPMPAYVEPALLEAPAEEREEAPPEPPVWDARRSRFIPQSWAGRPLIGAASGPSWVQDVARERAELDDYDAARLAWSRRPKKTANHHA